MEHLKKKKERKLKSRAHWNSIRKCTRIIFIAIVAFLIVWLLVLCNRKENVLSGKAAVSEQETENALNLECVSELVAITTLSETRYGNLLSDLSIILAAFMGLVGFFSIVTPFIQSKNLREQEKTLDRLLERQKSLHEEEVDIVLQMESLKASIQGKLFFDDQPTVAVSNITNNSIYNNCVRKFLEGVSYYQKSHEIDRKDTKEIIKNLQFAVRSFYAAIVKDAYKRSDIFYYWLALSYHEMLAYSPSNYNEILQELQENLKSAIDIEPRNPGYLAWLADTYREEGRYEESLEESQKAIQIIKSEAIEEGSKRELLSEIYMWQGVIYHEMGNYEKAIKVKKKAKKMGYDPDDMDASLATTLFMCGKYEEARKSMSKALCNAAVIDYSKMGNGSADFLLDEARMFTRSLIPGLPKNFYWVLSYLGQILLKEKIIEVKGGKTYNNMNSIMDKVEYYLSFPNEDNMDYRMYLRKAQAYILYAWEMNQKPVLQNAGVKKVLDKAYELNPMYPDTEYTYYRYYMAIGDTKTAENHIQEAIKKGYTEKTHKKELWGQQMRVGTNSAPAPKRIVSLFSKIVKKASCIIQI